jgi:hypothetical protein
LTGLLHIDLEWAMPSAFAATTTTRSRWPTSVEFTMYVAVEAWATFRHLWPLLQRCQAYRKDLG